ncbi:hypothetical protein AG1IA_10383 [Rhizoctonia solani AG-1 IA]|uniref:Uncharacterized protein n=1 Tax=Thanatephorus cucumeris (strain AG1-IA) TaxID=983506 RepID=L8WFU0_THACA|nr:hypothetical protein AG1IA_10383 [Rhizoctonia solani AG-1 IA]
MINKHTHGNSPFSFIVWYETAACLSLADRHIVYRVCHSTAIQDLASTEVARVLRSRPEREWLILVRCVSDSVFLDGTRN